MPNRRSFALLAPSILACCALGCSGATAGTSDEHGGPSVVNEEGGAQTVDAGSDLGSPAPDGSGGTDAGSDDTGPGAGGGVVLPSGTTMGATTVTCPKSAGSPAGATCTRLTVQCPGVEDIAATVAVTEPPGGSGATVVLHNGVGGTAFFNQNGVAASLVAKGMRTVQPAWATDWEVSAVANSALAAACRPATLFRWAFSQPHGKSRTAGFCAIGHSAGSGAISYAMAHYGLGDTLDYALLTAGSPFGRIDYGCAPSTYAGPPITMCPGAPTPIANAPIAYVTFAVPLLNKIEGTSTCAGSPNPQELARFAADSVVSPGAIYDYPKTPLSFFYCGNAPNETAGLGWFYNSRITSTKEIQCVAGKCSGEDVYSDPPTLAAIVDGMSASCVPRH